MRDSYHWAQLLLEMGSCELLLTLILNVILPISASQTARIIDISYQWVPDSTCEFYAGQYSDQSHWKHTYSCFPDKLKAIFPHSQYGAAIFPKRFRHFLLMTPPICKRNSMNTKLQNCFSSHK
jgi:hypothetical protein